MGLRSTWGGEAPTQAAAAEASCGSISTHLLLLPLLLSARLCCPRRASPLPPPPLLPAAVDGSSCAPPNLLHLPPLSFKASCSSCVPPSFILYLHSPACSSPDIPTSSFFLFCFLSFSFSALISTYSSLLLSFLFFINPYLFLFLCSLASLIYHVFSRFSHLSSVPLPSSCLAISWCRH